jgi:hypothetical protein
MDLAKIIGELRLELECVVSAIASMEELARVKSLSKPGARQAQLPDPSATLRITDAEAGGEPLKRRRGRPRKNPVQPLTDGLEPSPSADDSSTSTA